MDRVNITSSASAVDASFDTLARTFGRRLPRRQMFGLLTALVLVAIAVGTVVPEDATAASRRLGGFNLAADCQWYFNDPNARAYSNGIDPYSWQCVTASGVFPIHQHLFNVFAVHEHGAGAYAVLEGSRPTDWAAYR